MNALSQFFCRDICASGLPRLPRVYTNLLIGLGSKTQSASQSYQMSGLDYKDDLDDALGRQIISMMPIISKRMD